MRYVFPKNIYTQQVEIQNLRDMNFHFKRGITKGEASMILIHFAVTFTFVFYQNSMLCTCYLFAVFIF